MYLVLDASPLIYMAKLDAFDTFAGAGQTAVVPSSVYAEGARPELAFRHPEIATIKRIRDDGRLVVIDLDTTEQELATDLAASYGGLHPRELDVLALGANRGWTLCFHERQAARIARSLGLATIHVVEVLFAGTPDPDVLGGRIRHFARLTNMRMDDLDVLMNLIRERR